MQDMSQLFSGGASGGSNMLRNGVFNNNLWGGGAQTTVPGGGSNQWMSFPSMGGGAGTGGGFNPAVPSGSSPGGPMSAPPGPNIGGGGFGSVPNKPGDFFPGVGGKMDMGGNMFTQPTYDPTMTSAFYQWMHSQLGAGAGLQNNLLNFLSGGKSTIPGAMEFGEMAHSGDPISAMPEWRAMLDAQQQNIAQNQANLKEQFAFSGDLQSSPFGTAMTNFGEQTTKDQNALLAQMQTQAMEQAAGRKFGAESQIQSEAGAMDQFMQQLLQTSALASPGLFQKQKGSGLGGLLGGIGSLVGGIGALGGAAEGAGGIGALMAGLI